ncbi:MAG: hypothetical protein NT096_00685 [Proteobacteria bacterium]|nr:hypothetical protein [Pseudomonadota bacterium]
MSVVAGCSLFDGVLLAADCRATFKRIGCPDIHSDNVLKVFALLPHTAIGFVGDIDVASFLLRSLLVHIKNRKHVDPISLSNWLPRLFRYEFSRFNAKYGERTVIFMIASVLKDRPNIVQRKAVAELVNYIGFGKSPIQRTWMPSILIEILKIPPQYEWIQIPGTCRNILYVLASPIFEIRPYHPLQFAAIGSGQSCIEEIARYNDAIFALDPGNSFVESFQFRDIIQGFITERGIESVGGVYPVLKVTGRGVENLGISTQIPVGGTKIELVFEAGRWIQRNATMGKEIPLLMPWEFLQKPPMQNLRFDDLSEALDLFKSPKQK